MKQFLRAAGLLISAVGVSSMVLAAGASAPARGKAGKEAAAAVEPLRIAAAFDPVDQGSNGAAKAMALEAPIAKAIGVPVKVTSSRTLRDIAIGVRSGDFDALWVPSNIAVEAVKDARYEMVGFDGKMTRMALLASKSIAGFPDLKRKALYLPQEDSSAASIGIALLSDNGIRLSDFWTVYTSGSYEVASFALDRNFSAVTVMPEPLAKAYLSAHPNAAQILTVSDPVPGQTLVVRKTMNAAMRQQLAQWCAQQASVSGLAVASPAAYKYVTGVSHYTPDDVPGVQKVGAKEVVALAKEGVEIIDVRTVAEFDAKHLPGAKLVAYEERSPRFLGADMSNDGFDLSKLAGAKRIVLYCNGPECWKSFKAAVRAIGSKQFESVYWFRGGIPEWERSGLPFAGPNAAQVAQAAAPTPTR